MLLSNNLISLEEFTIKLYRPLGFKGPGRYNLILNPPLSQICERAGLTAIVVTVLTPVCRRREIRGLLKRELSILELSAGLVKIRALPAKSMV